MHVKVCPRLSLMYAIPLVSALWSLVFGPNTLNTLNTLITLNTPITQNTLIIPIPHSKKRACPKAHPQST
jgi:hypothetical protein